MVEVSGAGLGPVSTSRLGLGLGRSRSGSLASSVGRIGRLVQLISSSQALLQPPGAGPAGSSPHLLQLVYLYCVDGLSASNSSCIHTYYWPHNCITRNPHQLPVQALVENRRAWMMTWDTSYPSAVLMLSETNKQVHYLVELDAACKSKCTARLLLRLDQNLTCLLSSTYDEQLPHLARQLDVRTHLFTSSPGLPADLRVAHPARRHALAGSLGHNCCRGKHI